MVQKGIKGMFCPLCEASALFLSEKIPIIKLKTGWLEKFGIEVFSDIPDSTDIELYSCSACGLKFYYPFTLAGDAELYEKLNKRNLYYQKDKWEFLAALEDIRGVEKLLEIGCGEGEFLQLAGRTGIKETRGIEICGSAVECAKLKECNVDNISLEEAAEKYEGCFDAVCAFQVLEHSPHPRSFIANSLKMLKSGGKFIVGVPNAKSYLKNIFLLLDMPPHHMTKWCADTLEKLPKIFPLRVVKIKKEPLAEHQLNFFIEGLFKNLEAKHLPPFLTGGYPRKAAWLILRNRLVRHFLTGQTIYACYTKK